MNKLTTKFTSSNGPTMDVCLRPGKTAIRVFFRMREPNEHGKMSRAERGKTFSFDETQEKDAQEKYHAMVQEARTLGWVEKSRAKVAKFDAMPAPPKKAEAPKATPTPAPAKSTGKK